MKFFAITFLIVIFFSFNSFAQTDSKVVNDRLANYTQLTEAEKKILADYLTAKTSMGFCTFVPDGTGCKENNNFEQKYIDSLAKIVQSPKLTSYLVSGAAKNFEGLRISAKSAPQISQIADEQNAELIRIIVIQNQRIIELLEQIAKKK